MIRQLKHFRNEDSSRKKLNYELNYFKYKIVLQFNERLKTFLLKSM